MNASSKSSKPGSGTAAKPGFGKTKIGSVAVALVLALYAFLQPYLNEKYGLDLPGLSDRQSTTAVAENTSSRGPAPTTVSDSRTSDDEPGIEPPKTSEKSAKTSGSKSKSETADESKAKDNSGPKETKTGKTQGTTEKKQAEDSDLLFGILREVRHDRFLSPQGLQYNPGSAEGHRLEHLRRHIKDQPQRPGKHGVFDGGMEGALATIDRAYERAKKKIKTTKRVEGDRTIYTVDMGGRVGFVGGREGSRLRNPMARRVKIVLEGTQFITAFPL
ncbi:MAG: hypothetical protein AAFX06_03920 [Planctomycetota bacterium]